MGGRSEGDGTKRWDGDVRGGRERWEVRGKRGGVEKVGV